MPAACISRELQLRLGSAEGHHDRLCPCACSISSSPGPVADQVPEVGSAITQVHQQVALRPARWLRWPASPLLTWTPEPIEPTRVVDGKVIESDGKAENARHVL